MKKYIKKFDNFNKSAVIFLSKLKEEISQNTKLRKILARYVTDKKSITEEEGDFVKKQTLSLLKMLGLTSIIILPGSTLILPFLIALAKKYKINILPNSFIKESFEQNQVIEFIKDGKELFFKYIQDYPEHKRGVGYLPVDIDTNGIITVSIDGILYTTKMEWIEGIKEGMQHYEINRLARNEVTDDMPWKNDEEFKNLLKTHGDIKGLIKKMKNKYKIDYSDCEDLEQLYSALKSDGMI